jgi:hypothetical protein
MFGQRPRLQFVARRLAGGWHLARRLGLVGLQVFQLQLQLFDLVAQLSDLRPNCMRRNSAICSLRCSISMVRLFSCSRKKLTPERSLAHHMSARRGGISHLADLDSILLSRYSVRSDRAPLRIL